MTGSVLRSGDKMVDEIHRVPDLVTLPSVERDDLVTLHSVERDRH